MVPIEHRQPFESHYAFLNQIPFVDDQRLEGFNNFSDRYTCICSPMIEDDKTAVELRNLGIDRQDAHHIMLAIRGRCDVFLTCDRQTILSHRMPVQNSFPIRLFSPSELLAEMTDALSQP